MLISDGIWCRCIRVIISSVALIVCDWVPQTLAVVPCRGVKSHARLDVSDTDTLGLCRTQGLAAGSL